MKWHNVMLIGLLGLALALHSTAIASSFLSNSGLLAYLKFATCTVSDGQTALMRTTKYLYKAVELDASNTGAQRGLGFAAWQGAKDTDAFALWQNTGLTTLDYVVFGQHAGDRETALRWYALAERLEPTHPALWMEVGRLCQSNNQDEVCARFLRFNEDNGLVDADFVFDRAAWRFNRHEGADYAITDCPDVADKKCALVRIDTVTFAHGTGWHQCLVLEPGQRYVFSAWIKAETAGQWIPIYFQGSVNGSPDGHTLKGTQTGNRDWTYWEQTFTAPVFDEDRACFHPARLLDVGQLWFHSATLRVVE